MNKKLFFILTIIHLNIFCISAQIYPVRPQLSDKHSFSMILLPDPQSYNKFDANQPLFELQTAWIANSIEPLNIKGVLCTGDLVEQNEIRIPDGINGNQTSEEQWQAASRAFERLDDKISYVVCTGNHDYGYEKAENRLCHLPDYFPSERNSCWKKSLVETGLNYQGIPTLENAAYEFETDTWGKLLVISLEFAPRDEAIEWAAKVAGKAKYKNHKVILLTHSYMSPEAKRHIKESYKISPANYGEAICIIRKTKCFDFWERNVLFPKTKRSFFRTPKHPLPCPFPLNFSLLIITKKFGNLAKNRYICIV